MKQIQRYSYYKEWENGLSMKRRKEYRFVVKLANRRCIRPYTIKGMDWKRGLKLRDIRDMLYFKLCNFTLNTL